jgi:hypothetical protein
MYQRTADPGVILILDGHPQLTSGSQIHPKSKYWAEYLKYKSGGGFVRPRQPTEDHKWDGNRWITDEVKAAYRVLERMDKGITRLEEDLADAILALGGTLSASTQTKLDAKKAARAAYLAKLNQ